MIYFKKKKGKTTFARSASILIKETSATNVYKNALLSDRLVG